MALFPVRRQEAELFKRALERLTYDLSQILLLTNTRLVVEEMQRCVYYVTRELKNFGVREIDEVEIRPRLEWNRDIVVDVQPKGPMGEALIEGLHELEDEEFFLLRERPEDP